MEVFKYAVKFSDLTLADNWHAAQRLKGKRLLNSFGLFRGVEVPDSLLDEPLDGLPYWDRFYRYLQGEYQFTGESPKANGAPEDQRPRAYQPTPNAERKHPRPAVDLVLPGGHRPDVLSAQPKCLATLLYEGEQRVKRARKPKP